MNNFNSLVLAYIGDAVYELYVRNHLINNNISKVNDLQKEAKKYVCAKSQALFLKHLIENNYLSEDEVEIVKRARNSKSNSKPKNTDILTYKHSTALEALIGFHYTNQNFERNNQIMNHIWSLI